MLARWVVAAAVFMAIGLVDMRFGHAVGLTTLILAIVAAFVMDSRSRIGDRSEPRASRQPEAHGSDGPASP